MEARKANREESSFCPPCMGLLQSLEEGVGGAAGKPFSEEMCAEEFADKYEASFQETICREGQMISLIN